MTDPLQAHRAFVRAARTGNFSRAGRELGLSQPSISRLIAKLESELGTALFHRSTRTLRLTDVGLEYLSRIEGVINAMDEANEAARGGSELKGLLRLAVSTSFGLREVVPRLAPFLRAHPALRLDLIVSDERQNLVSEAIDVAFRLGRLDDSNHIARKLGESPRILVASPLYLNTFGNVNHPSELIERCFIVGPAAAPSYLEFIRGGQAVSVAVAGHVSCSNNEGAVALASAGLGICVTSEWGVRRELEEGQLLRILGDWMLPAVEVHAIYSSGRKISVAARHLVSHLAASFDLGAVPEPGL